MPSSGKIIFAKERRAKLLVSKCHKCTILSYKVCCKTLGMIFDNHEDKIKFIKEWLDDILQSLEIHPNRNVQR